MRSVFSYTVGLLAAIGVTVYIIDGISQAVILHQSTHTQQSQ